jgi:hypothetical protein
MASAVGTVSRRLHTPRTTRDSGVVGVGCETSKGAHEARNHSVVISSVTEAIAMAHPVAWFQISGPDGGALEAFYGGLFGWRMEPSPDGSMKMVAADEGGINGGIATAPDGRANVTVYVGVSDVAEHLKKVQDAGGAVAMPPMQLPEGMGWIAGFIDPAGNWMGLWQQGAPPSAPAKRAKKAAKKAVKKVAPAKPKKAAKKAPAKPAKAVKAAPAKKTKKKKKK